jgi:hypothetical protein
VLRLPVEMGVNVDTCCILVVVERQTNKMAVHIDSLAVRVPALVDFMMVIVIIVIAVFASRLGAVKREVMGRGRGFVRSYGTRDSMGETFEQVKWLLCCF